MNSPLNGHVPPNGPLGVEATGAIGDETLAAGAAAGPLKVVVACDHRGFAAKQRIVPFIEQAGHAVTDLGCDDAKACDYPDFAAPAAFGVRDGKWHAAILFDGSGIGMGIVANKVPGIRAAICHDEVTARLAREHNHCNVLCLGTDLIGPETQANIVKVFLETPFNAGRHTRRLAKLTKIEADAHPHPHHDTADARTAG